MRKFLSLSITSLFQNAFDSVPVILGLALTLVLEIIRFASRMIWGIMDNLLFWPEMVACVVPTIGFFVGGLGSNLVYEVWVIHAFGHRGLGAKAPAALNWVCGGLLTALLELPVLAIWRMAGSYVKACEQYQEAWYFAITLGEQALLAIPTALILLVIMLLLAAAAWMARMRATTRRLRVFSVVGYILLLVRCWLTMGDFGLPLVVRILWTVATVVITAVAVLRG